MLVTDAETPQQTEARWWSTILAIRDKLLAAWKLSYADGAQIVWAPDLPHQRMNEFAAAVREALPEAAVFTNYYLDALFVRLKDGSLLQSPSVAFCLNLHVYTPAVKEPADECR